MLQSNQELATNKASTQQVNNNINIITSDNIQDIAQRITIRALKTVLQASADKFIIQLYNNLIADIININNNLYLPVSDAYDLVQEASLFLYNILHKHASESVTLDKCITRKKDNKQFTILRACFSILNKKIYTNKKENYTRIFIEDLESKGNYLLVPFEWDIDKYQDFVDINIIIDNMQLSVNEKKFIYYRLRGLSLGDIAKKMGTSKTTVQKTYQRRVRQKAQAFGLQPTKNK